jgi:hypothetical protein
MYTRKCNKSNAQSRAIGKQTFAMRNNNSIIINSESDNNSESDISLESEMISDRELKKLEKQVVFEKAKALRKQRRVSQIIAPRTKKGNSQVKLRVFTNKDKQFKMQDAIQTYYDSNDLFEYDAEGSYYYCDSRYTDNNMTNDNDSCKIVCHYVDCIHNTNESNSPVLCMPTSGCKCAYCSDTLYHN